MKNIFLLLSVVLIFWNCDNDDIDNITPNNEFDIYIAGKKSGQPCYWKNGDLVMLDNSGLENYRPISISVSNGNVHVFGSNYDNIQDPFLVYWKNGIRTEIESQLSLDLGAIINNYYFEGADEYFSGIIPNSENPSNWDIVYWKNSVMHTVLENVQESKYTKIAVKNGEVYVLMYEEMKLVQIYNNGNIINIDNNYDFKNHTFKNNDFILQGYSENPQSSSRLPVYYNLSEMEETVVQGMNSWGGIRFEGENLFYSSGTNNSGIQLLKNGNSIYTSPEGYETHLYDFEVYNDNLYSIVRTLNITSDFGDFHVMRNNEIIFTLEYVEGESSDNWINDLCIVNQ